MGQFYFRQKQTINKALKRLNPSGDFNCYYCSVKIYYPDIIPPNLPESFTLDHFVPKFYGGTSHMSNLRPCCHKCNHIRGFGSDPSIKLLKKIEMVDNYVKQKPNLNLDFFKYLFNFHSIESREFKC